MSTASIHKLKLYLCICLCVFKTGLIQAQIRGAAGFNNPALLHIEIDICSDCEVLPLAGLHYAGGAPFYPEGGFAICDDGTYYSAFWENIYNIDPTSGEASLIPGLPEIPYPGTVQGLAGIVCSGIDGILYGIHDPLAGDELLEIDINNLTITSIGSVPFLIHHGMFMYHDEVYASSYQGVVKIDTIQPANSILVFPYPPEFYCFGLTVYECYNSLLLFGTQDFINEPAGFYLMSLVDGTLTKSCLYSDHSWMSLASIPGTGETSCGSNLDLDCDDSSGADGFDYAGTPFTCKTQGIRIADEDVFIGADSAIAEMSIIISPATIEDAAEILDITGSVAPLEISGTGTSQLIITNPGGGKIQDFKDALQLIVYRNESAPLTSGPREVEVFYTMVHGEISNTAIAYLEVVQLDSIPVDLGPDTTLCEGETLVLDATYLTANYEWSNGATTGVITVSEPGHYLVTVSNNTRCTNIDDIVVDVIPVIEVTLTGDSSVCLPNSGELHLTNHSDIPIDVEIEQDPNGPDIEVNGLVGSISIPVFPDGPTDYTIASIIPQEEACIIIHNQGHFMEVYEDFHHMVDTTICNGDSILIGTSWETMQGSYSYTYTSVLGCDSLVEYDLVVLPSEIILINMETCDPDAAGVFVEYLPNTNGCDTVVRTTIHLLPVDTTVLNFSTCNISMAGTVIDTLINNNGCDSLIISVTTYIPPVDTTFVQQFTCDSSMLGIQYEVMQGSDLCDSLVVTTTLFSDIDTIYLSGHSCIPQEIGVFENVYTGSDQCDSVVITTIVPGMPDTTNVFLTSCDSSVLGVHETLLTGTNGCDSLIIETISYSDKDTTLINTFTCIAGEEGVFITSLSNQFGCDSIVIETVVLQISHQDTIQSASCNPADTGIFVQYLTNQFGCDSTVTTLVELLQSHDVYLESQSCVDSDTGTFVTVLENVFGCDSIVTHHVSFRPIETTFIFGHTCYPEEASLEGLIFQTDSGCDSLVIIEILYAPVTATIINQSDYNGYPVSCAGAQDAAVGVEIEGSGTFTYLWSTLETTPSIAGLTAGDYSITVTDYNGCSTTATVALIEPAPLQMGLIIPTPSCFDQELGFITAEVVGGVPPFQYSLDGGPYQADPTFQSLPEGTYELTVIDANQCTSTEFIWINQLLPVEVSLGDNVEIPLGDTAFLTAMINIPVDSLNSITWQGVEACPTCLTQFVSPVITTSYSVEVVTVDGCADHDTMTVSVVRDHGIYIPNVFSPNGDGNNDRLVIYTGSEIDRILSFTIFDRWGGIMFNADNLSPGATELSWDGNSRGTPTNQGVYVYRLEAILQNLEIIRRVGSVTVWR